MKATGKVPFETEALADLSTTKRGEPMTEDDSLTIESVQTSSSQKAFEAWAKEHMFNIRKDEQVISEGVFIYANPMTQGAYMAWCAASAKTIGA